jgi:hypothetical protein
LIEAKGAEQDKRWGEARNDQNALPWQKNGAASFAGSLLFCAVKCN